MPTSLVTQHYPDDFQVCTFPIMSAPVDPFPAFYADRDMVVDSVTVGVQAAGGANGRLFLETAAAPNADSGTVFCTINIDGTSNTTAGDTIISTTDGVLRREAAGTSGNVGASTLINAENNLVKAGQWVMLDFGGTVTGFRGVVQVRFRSRVA